jgi:hypothetical protein
MHKYLFVYDRETNSFPERWKIIDAGDCSEVSPKIRGHIEVKDVEKKRESFKQHYSDNNFVISSSYANCWEAIEHNTGHLRS